MKILRCQKGVALLLALVLGLISVVFLSGVLLMIGTGARLSGVIRSYTSAVEAARGGVDLICRLLRRGASVGDYEVFVSMPDKDCLESKLSNETNNWSCNDTCATSFDLSDMLNCYDMSKSLGDYDLYLKITDTKHYLVGGKNVYVYTVQSLAVSKHNPNEKAWVTFVYKAEET